MARGSVGGATFMVGGPKFRRHVKKVQVRRHERCWRCRGPIPAATFAMRVTAMGDRHYEHFKCYIPRGKKRTRHKPAPVTVTWVEPTQGARKKPSGFPWNETKNE